MLGMVFAILKRPVILLISMFSVINLACMGLNRGNSHDSNATSLKERDTVV